MKQINILIQIVFITLITSCRNNHDSTIGLPLDTSKVNLLTSRGIGNNYKDFSKLGYRKGQKISKFSLFTIDDIEFKLDEALQKNKALLLISGSYTCDISRSNLQDINALLGKYQNYLNIYIVYTIDAHPCDVPSPYSSRKQIELAPANIRDHIESKQPKTYGERKRLAAKWKQQNTIIAPILVDDPMNSFWINFGQAPNMAYLITPDGQVYTKQTWFTYVEMNNSIREWIRSSKGSN